MMLDSLLLGLPQEAEADTTEALHDAHQSSGETVTSSVFTDPAEQRNMLTELAQSEELMGRSPEEALASARKTVELVQQVTDYPTEPKPRAISSEQLASAMFDMFK